VDPKHVEEPETPPSPSAPGGPSSAVFLRPEPIAFRLFLQCIQDYAIFMIDPYGRVQMWSPAAERMKGYTPQEIIGRHFSSRRAAELRAPAG
jgi:PAS domain-containing protein